MIFLMLIFVPLYSSLSSVSINPNDIKYENLKIESDTENSIGYRYNIKGWIYVYIEGGPIERGFLHGKLLTKEIIELINRWAHSINNFPDVRSITSKGPPEMYHKVAEIWWDFCKNQCYDIYWGKFPEEFKNEIIGIANGVNENGGKIFNQEITFKDILASNMMYEFISKLTEWKNGIHPIRTFFGELKRHIPEFASQSEEKIYLNFIKHEPIHHCSGFIATGNATTHGQIVATDSMWCAKGSWWWTFYISLRWNIILDINPTNDGNRIIMSSVPGYIWSDHDYYQNDDGIVLIETTCHQGLWDNRGLPVAVRARRAIQYGNNIDDVLNFLIKDNDGAMNSVWLIGDTKTGEICRLDLGLYKYGIYRKYNGFYWSANNPIDFGVRMEKLNLFRALKYWFLHIFQGTPGYEYYVPWYVPGSRDIKFEELGNQFYGKIDVDVVKDIMSTRPISAASTDCKLSDSEMIDNLSMWAFFGKLTNKSMELENYDNKHVIIEIVPPCGWLRFYGIQEGKEFAKKTKNNDLDSEPYLCWYYNTSNIINYFEASSIIIDGELYSFTTDGEMIVNNISSGIFLWNISNLGINPTLPVVYDNQIFVGNRLGLLIIDKNSREVRYKKIGSVISKPVLYNNDIIVGNDEGDVYSFDIESGKENWRIKLPDEPFISELSNNNVFIASGKKCYCINVDYGLIEWYYTTNGKIKCIPYVDNCIVYFGSWDNYFYAIEKNNRTLLWKYETGWGIETVPIISDFNVYFGSHDHNFYALNKLNGSLVWFFTCKAGIHSNPIIVKNNILFGSDDGYLYCLDKIYGDIIWSFSPNFTYEGINNYINTPLISNLASDEKNVIFGINGQIFSLEI
jgi:outer membrane protein assembly factor BamB